MQPFPPAALAHAFASIGGCPPELLEALAQRGMELEGEGRLDVQVGGQQCMGAPAMRLCA